MKKTLQLLTFVLAMATAVALAQTSSGSSTTSSGPSWGPPSTPASQSTNNSKSPVDDATLGQQIDQQLASDPALKNVKATVSNGVVDLEGTVASKADKKHAKQVVASMPGVRKVHDKLTINTNATATPGSNEPTTASAGNTASASSTTPQTPAPSANTTASATTGAATPAAGMPQSDASPGANPSVSGATTQAPSTEAGAQATPGTPGTGAPTSAADSLGDVEHQINTALKHEPVLSNDQVHATVGADSIELTGMVGSGRERQTAMRIAQSFAGNRRVVDRMTVGGQGAGTGATPGQGVSGTTPGAGATGTGNTGTNPSSTPTNPTIPQGTTTPR